MNIIKALLNQSLPPEKKFQDFMQVKARYLLGLTQLTANSSLTPTKLNRLLLNQLYISSIEVEEFMDYADALVNSYWYTFRRNVAIIKILSEICSKLLHIDDSYSGYYLLPIEGDFKTATTNSIKMLRDLLINASSSLLNEAKKCKLKVSDIVFPDLVTGEVPYNFHLPATKRMRHESNPGTTVVALATDLLNLSEPNDLFECIYFENIEDLMLNFVPDYINAEKIRSLEVHFHNMQSKYDTFVSGSDLPQQDKNLPIMRGHISIIFHLLKVAKSAVHYYQRHIVSYQSKTPLFNKPHHDNQSISSLVSYALIYADRYRKASRELCRMMLKRYAQIGTIEVSTPNYRGFHIRPSTLISKIVHHYGSDVKMILYDQEYDTAMPLDLFRANEVLNAHKRKNICHLATQSKSLSASPTNGASFTELKEVCRNVFIELAEQHLIIIYDAFFNFTDMQEESGEDYLSFLKRAIVRYMALGKFDAAITTLVTFEGDKRVLEDLKLLADHGYGEDSRGNNIVLPTRLTYLRQNCQCGP